MAQEVAVVIVGRLAVVASDAVLQEAEVPLGEVSLAVEVVGALGDEVVVEVSVDEVADLVDEAVVEVVGLDEDEAVFEVHRFFVNQTKNVLHTKLADLMASMPPCPWKQF